MIKTLSLYLCIALADIVGCYLPLLWTQAGPLRLATTAGRRKRSGRLDGMGIIAFQRR